MKRRELIRAGMMAGVAGVAGAAPIRGLPAVRPAGRRVAKARNIIFVAYDGLTWEDVAVAQFHARRTLGRPLALAGLLGGGRSGSMETYSLTSVVTDSAAAACAWSTGRKGVNYMVNVYPDGTRLTPVLEIARALGRATGLVTTTRVTHATPAAWATAVPSRDSEDEIAAQYVAFRPDVLLGGGARHFRPGRRKDGRDLEAELRTAGYDVVHTAGDLGRSNASRVVGLFTDDHLPFEIDRTRQGAAAPSLAAMTRKALDVLDGHDSGFVAMVEAGRIDHANHKNDAAATLHDVLAADVMLAEVLEWVDGRTDTLLILASDHGTGSGAAYGAGRQYRNSTTALARIARHDASFDHIIARLRAEPTEAAMAAVLAQHTGVTPDAQQLEVLAAVLAENRSPVNRVAYQDQPFNTLGHIVYGGGAALHADRVNINFATGQHTAGPVPVAVHGCCAGGLRPTFVDNTEAFGWMMAALGADHVNPAMSEEAALELLRSGEEAAGTAAARQPVHA